MSDIFQLERMQIARFTCEIRAKVKARLPVFLGSTLRGALGMALKQTSCPMQCNNTIECPRQEECAYAWCFETPVPEGKEQLKGSQKAPHPFVIIPPTVGNAPWYPGEPLYFSILLIGQAIPFFPHFVVAIERMATTGLGLQQAPFVLIAIRDSLRSTNGPLLWDQSTTHIINPTPQRAAELVAMSPPPSTTITLQFQTPLRIVEKKRPIEVLHFRSFARSLLSRINALQHFHCDTELEISFKQLLEEAEATTILRHDLQRETLHRWSNRQQEKIPMDGLLGEVRWKGDSIQCLWPLLHLGQWIHAGKSATMGLGRYEVLYK